MKILIIPLLLLVIASPSLGLEVNITVLYPKSFNLSSSETNVLFPHFGHIPWGSKVIGRLVLPNPADACEPFDLKNEPKENFIVVVQRGNCELYIKAQNAEKAGVRMLLIVENNDTFNFIKLPPSTAELINLPVLMIKKSIGDRFIEDLIIGIKEISEIIISVDFSVISRESPSYYVGISSGNREGYRFLRGWRPYYLILNSTSNFVPNYLSQPIKSLGDKNQSCLCHFYCVPSQTKNLPVSDFDAANENLRQLCIFNELGMEKWWDYVLAYEQFCLDEIDVKACSLKIRKALDLDGEKIDSCVTKSLQDEAKCRNIFENKLTSKFSFYNHLSSFIIDHPNITVDKNLPYIRNLLPIGLFEAMCSAINSPPDECTNGAIFDSTRINRNLHRGHSLPPFEIEEKIKSELSSGGIGIGYIIVAVLVILAVGFFLGRRYAKRQQFHVFEGLNQNNMSTMNVGSNIIFNID